ncbi:hypothetical protein C5167_012610 [Papaver somniferum]|uniref:DUF1985 domain-containing protein n=1 Tax=Papaver somniferum TaxID=3469 RepID=A0A4Y7J146_PAPSO|nr:hypothetical protein C5167_012610 [Papaver somniferum]
MEIKELIKNKQLHLKALKSCPFWRFFEPFYDGVMNEQDLIKKRKAVIMFLSSIENREDGRRPYCFKITRSRKMTLRTIPEYFAVTFGFQMVNYVQADVTDEDLVTKVKVFVAKYFKGSRKTGKTDIKNCMLEAAKDETRADDFVKFFIMFLLFSVFVPNKCGQTLEEKYLYMVFDMNNVCWPEVFHDYLLDSIMTNRKDVEKVVSCVIYPLYWLAKMIKIAQRKDGLDKYPRFARWNLSDICQQVLSNFSNLYKKTELLSEDNISHRKGPFLLQYDEQEMRLVKPMEDDDIVVEDHVEPELPIGNTENVEENVEVPATAEENVGASSEANTYKARYQWARTLIEKLRTNATNVLSEEEESLMAKYDAEDREQQPVQSTYLRRKRKQDDVPIVPEAVSNREEDVPIVPEAVSNREEEVEVLTRDAANETHEDSAQAFDNVTMEQEKNSSKAQEDAAETLDDFLMQPEKDSTIVETQHEAATGGDPILASVFSDVDLTNLLKQIEGEPKEQVIYTSSKPATEDEQVGEGNELTPNTVEDIKVAEQVESEMKNASLSNPATEDEQEGVGNELTPNTIEDIKVAEQVESEMKNASSSKPVIGDEQEGEGTELTPNTIEDIKVADQVEYEMKKASSSKHIIEQEENRTQFVIDEDVIQQMESEYNKKGCSSSKPNFGSVYYYSAIEMASDLVELENEEPGFNLGLSQSDNKEQGQGEISAEKRMSNMITRMREEIRKTKTPIRMRDYTTVKRRKVTAHRCKNIKEVQEDLGVKLKPVDNLKILKLLNRNEKTLVTTFFRKNNERSTAWEHMNLQLRISGKMMDNLMRKGDVAGDIIEFYMLKLQNNIKNIKLKQDGNLKYKRPVFLSTFVYTLQSLGKRCGAVIEGFIDNMDYIVQFLFVLLLTTIGDKKNAEKVLKA